MEKSQVRVCSWNEWDPLKHVILGYATDCHIPPVEPALDAKIPNDCEMRGRCGRRPQDSIERGNALLEDFANILRKRGIRVDRPQPLDFSRPVSTPDFYAGTMFGCMPARDVLLTVGEEILEATMSYRCRWFEYLCYRPLLQSYWEQDPDFRHEAAPKPRLTDRDYRPDYLNSGISLQQRLDWTARKHFVTTEEEPLFDAADVLRFGKDLIVQHGFTTNLKGIEWLRRHFRDHRVHAVNFPGDPYPIHIDATFMPLRPGLIISNPQRKLPEEQRELFQRNDWQIIDAAQPAHNEPPPLCYSSVWLSMNVLILDQKTVCVEKSEVYQATQLDKLGFEVIEVDLRDAYAFGGGLHCATADVLREGTCEDYFPCLSSELES
ncbi:MAG: serine/threonine protein kinase [Rhodobacteraceae bacterium]|nr:serine/threonine protein kinase [Paracoccaceae bacterium]MCY4196832.1 serine/threonine protein kinase [Paracoccaceae bacterium]